MQFKNLQFKVFCWTLILLDQVTNDRRKVEISAQIKTDFPLMCNEVEASPTTNPQTQQEGF